MVLKEAGTARCQAASFTSIASCCQQRRSTPDWKRIFVCDSEFPDDFFLPCRSLGYKVEDGEVEAQDKFLRRMSGLMRLYAAIIISPHPRGPTAPHPWGIDRAWIWLARIINQEPHPDITATLIYDLLKVRSRKQQQQFAILCNVMEYNAILHTKLHHCIQLWKIVLLLIFSWITNFSGISCKIDVVMVWLIEKKTDYYLFALCVCARVHMNEKITENMSFSIVVKISFLKA